MAVSTLKEVAWITGGASGIGRAVALTFAQRNYAVAISGRSSERLSLAASEIERMSGVKVFQVVCDSTNGEDVTNAVAKIVDYFKSPVSLLVNSAGIAPFSTFSETTTKEFDEVIAVNLKGAFLCSKAVLPAMYLAKRGTIVQILSIASEKAFKGGAAYAASKFALRGFTDSLREEARKRGVRVIGILPGAVETEMWDSDEREKFHERMMQPEDIAHAILSAIDQPERALVEEVRMRPIGGDL